GAVTTHEESECPNLRPAVDSCLCSERSEVAVPPRPASTGAVTRASTQRPTRATTPTSVISSRACSLAAPPYAVPPSEPEHSAFPACCPLRPRAIPTATTPHLVRPSTACCPTPMTR